MWRLQILVGFLIIFSKFGGTLACESGWTEYRGACFKLFTEPATGEAAQSSCGDAAASVVKPKTFGIQALVQGMMIGQAEGDSWLSMLHTGDSGGWTYLDGTPVGDCDWTNWGPASNGELSSNDAADGEQCALMTGATGWGWEDTSCWSLGRYICQAGDVTGISDDSCGNASVINTPCPSGWTAGPGDLCYKVSATVATFADAEADCASQGARLAAPYDERTHQFIAGMAMLVNPNSDHWIGIIMTHPWLSGVVELLAESFGFSDGLELDICGYTNFKTGHPGQDVCCGYMDSTDGYKWGFGGTDPDLELHYVCQMDNDTMYICEANSDSVTPVEPCPVNEFACPCSGQCCIVDYWVCDDFDDCLDYSDEAVCQVEGEGVWLYVQDAWVLEWIGDDGPAAVDINRQSIWNAIGQDRYYNNWYIIIDFQIPHSIQHVRIINYGDLWHDVTAFRLDASPTAEPYQWNTIYYNGSVEVQHSIPQVFSGFSGSGRYWKFTAMETYEGWQPWLKDVKFHGYLIIPETTTSSAPTTIPVATTTMPSVTTVPAAPPVPTTPEPLATTGPAIFTTLRNNSTTLPPMAPLSNATQRMGAGGAAAANTGGASGGAVAGGVVGTLAVVGVGGAVAGYLLYKKKQVVVEPKA
ncbi:macrophage mannose receptor 1-like [Branchiostoma floridae]|uniref:Macrophage mannose receptor 1-like n=1 Tax=Branchiostoma floridae TaxID=7739 RepID=A0A9J7MTF0_BRAFL|nr:macrophage mannose receptor 1-like [Branchiostoma floridae]